MLTIAEWAQHSQSRRQFLHPTPLHCLLGNTVTCSVLAYLSCSHRHRSLRERNKYIITLTSYTLHNSSHTHLWKYQLWNLKPKCPKQHMSRLLVTGYGMKRATGKYVTKGKGAKGNSFKQNQKVTNKTSSKQKRICLGESVMPVSSLNFLAQQRRGRIE